MVHFMYNINLTRLEDAQISGKTFLGVSVRGFLGGISTWINRLRKADDPHQCGWAWSDPLRAWIEQKTKEGQICSFCLNWNFHLFLLLDIDTSSSQIFRLGLGLMSLALMVLRCLGLDWNDIIGIDILRHSPHWFPDGWSKVSYGGKGQVEAIIIIST